VTRATELLLGSFYYALAPPEAQSFASHISQRPGELGLHTQISVAQFGIDAEQTFGYESW
jgi:hypothetical protein